MESLARVVDLAVFVGRNSRILSLGSSQLYLCAWEGPSSFKFSL